ncbi:MAG: hypothetical protein QM647_18375 [Asticcacaulis sp.]|uniref:hypothetical protein n=1 Tax=Asticcacaulis sp. TaxID=1872648 RepID=UPI0039E32151
MPSLPSLLTPGLFADVDGDWRILVIDADPRRDGVFYLGSYPYDPEGRPLHPQAPAILNVWNPASPGARQISDRQKRFANVTVTTLVEPVYEKRHA